MAAPLQVSFEDPDTLRLVGDIDMSSEERLREAFATISGPLSLDMAEVTFMDSTGLQLITARMRRTPVKLISASTFVHRVLERTGIKTLPNGDLVFG
jgi:anti-anti-sigma factor